MDELDLGYLMAVAGALVWTPRPLRSWLAALAGPRGVIAYAKSGEREPPAGAESLGADAIARVAAIDDAAAESALDDLRASGARAIADDDSDYPQSLRELCDPPPVIYVRGDSAALHGRAVAVVGSRAATSYGRTIASNLAADFASYGAAVVSGLARGIDAAAHKGAVEARGRTIAVIGSGLSRLYPPYHALLADDIVEGGGAIISEFPPKLPAMPHQFPMRNRIVAALGQATVVVEAGVRSGALITARLADEIGRLVFAVPGDVGRATSAGTNQLIKDGVQLITSASDVVELLRWDVGCALRADDRTGDPLVALLDSFGTHVEELSARTGLTIAELLAKLTLLEIGGAVERLPGGAYAAVTARLAAKADAP